MKPVAVLFPIVLMLCFLLAGCGQSGGTQAQNMQNESVTDTESQPDSEENSTENKSSDTVTDANDNTQSVLNESGYPVFDFEKKTVTLSSGYEMPILGLGMFSLYHRGL